MKRYLSFCAFFLLLGVAIADNSIPKLTNMECKDEGIYYKVKAGHTGTVKLWVDLEVTGKDGGYHDFDAVLIDPNAYTLWTVSYAFCQKYKLSLWQDYNQKQEKLIGKLDETDWINCK